jgi:hypothetical protein
LSSTPGGPWYRRSMLGGSRLSPEGEGLSRI